MMESGQNSPVKSGPKNDPPSTCIGPSGRYHRGITRNDSIDLNFGREPDLMISIDAPKDVGKKPGKTLVVGDAKFRFDASGRTRARTLGQLDGMINHARDYSHSRTVVYIALIPPSRQRTAALKRLSVRKGALLKIISARGVD